MPNNLIITPKAFAIVLLASAGKEVGSFMIQVPESASPVGTPRGIALNRTNVSHMHHPLMSQDDFQISPHPLWGSGCSDSFPAGGPCRDDQVQALWGPPGGLR